MPETDKKDANDAIMRAVAALGTISINVIKYADDERIEEFVAALPGLPRTLRARHGLLD